MRLFDTHCHLNDEAYQGDLPAVLTRAREAGVVRMLVVGYDLPSSERALRLAETEAEIYAAVGIHPHEAVSVTPAVLRRLEAPTRKQLPLVRLALIIIMIIHRVCSNRKSSANSWRWPNKPASRW